MPLNIVRNDITKMAVDAIVNAANETLLGGGGVDGRIHAAAGPGLLAQCRALGGCPVGEARITGAGNLPCRWVIHAVGPLWQGGNCGEEELLGRCYRAALALAAEKGCETVAVPLIASGALGFPRDRALRVAVEAIGNFLLEHDMTVWLAVFDRQSYQISGKLFSDIAAYIDGHYVETHTDPARERSRRMLPGCPGPMPQAAPSVPPPMPSMPPPAFMPLAAAAAPQSISLDDALRQLDESFSEMLLRKIDESGMTDAQCYKKANIDRKLFSKIRSDRGYKPSKPTVLAFAIALELSLEETKEMLMKAGFALSHSNKFDIIVEFFIGRGNYNVLEINEALFAFDQSLLGA